MYFTEVPRFDWFGVHNMRIMRADSEELGPTFCCATLLLGHGAVVLPMSFLSDLTLFGVNREAPDSFVRAEGSE